MILLIDNYDSFTYNLVQLIGGIGRERADLWHAPLVVRNACADVAQLDSMNPDFLIVSPGPCTPNEAGISNAAIRHFHNRIPILGVCLGHQCIAEVFGARVERAGRVMHGKTSEGFHDGRTIFESVPNPFTAMRYHSLHVPRASLPADWAISAWTEKGGESGSSHARTGKQAASGTLDDAVFYECMAIRHATAPTEGVQFHPESFLTPDGKQLMTNFLKQTGRSRTHHASGGQGGVSAY